MSVWRPRTTGILIGGVVLVVIASAVAFMISTFHPLTEIRMGSGVFKARIADDESERVKGLSGVSQLNPDDALLMVFDSDDKWGIWMKGMEVPIDILWLDSAKKVVHIVKNASPELSTETTFKPTDNARYVIEIPAGSVEKNNIKLGETTVFTINQEQN